jgi:polyhydroxyalkanoate synthesis regulator phasin
MAFSDSENARVLAIEDMLNKLQIAVNNLASKRQLSQLTMLKQSTIDNLVERVTTLESQIKTLQSSIG